MGLRVARSGDAYASTDGQGNLLLAEPPHLDPDDCLAQMIFHELCHWLVQGDDARSERDWGLDNETERDVPREHACLRLQAALLRRHGLRHFLAPTTDYRVFYDALPDDPLSPRWDPTVSLAILGLRRAESPPFAPHLAEALRATEAVAAAASRFAARRADGSPRQHGADDALLGDQWTLVDVAPTPHPSGLPPGPPSLGATCGTCAWRVGTRGACRQAGRAVRAEWPACERWEPPLDCQECGACCRAAYDCVQVSPRDPVRKKHPELVVLRGPFFEVRRQGDRCAALRGGVPDVPDVPRSFTPYACAIYDDRPRSCRDFERTGPHCLVARRRVGLSL
jgi:hypothetical protein